MMFIFLNIFFLLNLKEEIDLKQKANFFLSNNFSLQYSNCSGTTILYNIWNIWKSNF